MPHGLHMPEHACGRSRCKPRYCSGPRRQSMQRHLRVDLRCAVGPVATSSCCLDNIIVYVVTCMGGFEGGMHAAAARSVLARVGRRRGPHVSHMWPHRIGTRSHMHAAVDVRQSSARPICSCMRFRILVTAAHVVRRTILVGLCIDRDARPCIWSADQL